MTRKHSYVLVVDRVEGNQAWGHGQSFSHDTSRPFKFHGTIEGNKLTWGDSVVTELELVGDELRGHSSTGSKLLLVRKKP